MKYRHKQTGEILTAQQVLEQKPKGLLVPPPECWNERICEKLGVDKIHPSSPPEHDTKKESVLPDGARKKGRYWIQKWKIVPLYQTVLQQQEAAIRSVERLCEQRWKSGRVMVDGVPYRTNEKGIALLQTATYYNRKTRRIVSKGQVYERTPEQLREAKVACDNYVQACFDNAAKLIEQIQSSDDPLSIDISDGWPVNE
jgi:hypothetical protein